ncbi:MAG: hypothetical protein A2033_05660 [Bacteroidetes bacterium GWA2_31_9]|nr:MAG: hypothetical protein A2033_05660 [Bacteroidetes bacterium GWA2_31_9]
MKFYLKIALVLITFNTVSAFSQSFKGGLLAGMVASQVDGDMFAGYNKPGTQFGGFVNIQFGTKIGGQAELKFIQKGSREISRNEMGDYAAYYKLSLNYIEMPFLFTVLIKKKMKFEVGSGFAYLAKALEDTDGYGWYTPEPSFNNIEIPFIIGYNFALGKKLIANFRYSYSMTPIRNHPGNQTYWNDRGQYNNLISFALYYKFKDE